MYKFNERGQRMSHVIVSINTDAYIPGIGKGPIKKAVISEQHYRNLQSLGYIMFVVDSDSRWVLPRGEKPGDPGNTTLDPEYRPKLFPPTVVGSVYTEEEGFKLILGFSASNGTYKIATEAGLLIENTYENVSAEVSLGKGKVATDEEVSISYTVPDMDLESDITTWSGKVPEPVITLETPRTTVTATTEAPSTPVVSWEDKSTTGAVKYNVFRLEGSDQSKKSTVVEGSTELTVTDSTELTPEATYTFFALSVDKDGNVSEFDATKSAEFVVPKVEEPTPPPTEGGETRTFKAEVESTPLTDEEKEEAKEATKARLKELLDAHNIQYLANDTLGRLRELALG